MYTLPGRSIGDIPTLKSERLRLRAYHPDDFPHMYAMWQDKRFVRHIGNRKRSSGEVWGTMQRQIGSWALFGYGYLVIEDRFTDDFIGEAGFGLSRREEVVPALPLEPEAGWGIAPAYWGQGITLEAMTAMVDWMSAQDPNFPSHCIMDVTHAPSRKVAEALGYVLEGPRSFGADQETNVFVRYPKGNA